MAEKCINIHGIKLCKYRVGFADLSTQVLFKVLHSSMGNFLNNKFNLYNFKARIASSILYKKAKNCKEPLEYIHLANEIFSNPPLKYVGWPINPGQVNEEIQMLLSTIRKLNIASMLEIGTRNGGTLFLFSRMANPNAKIISLDLPGGEFGGGYETFKMPFFTNFAWEKQKIFLLRADSHQPSSLRKVEATLGGKALDFLFIDGDHTYKGVKEDFEMYSPLVRKGGLITFHDICKHPPSMGVEVSEFWSEIKRSYNYQEVINDPCQEWAGIGLIYT